MSRPTFDFCDLITIAVGLSPTITRDFRNRDHPCIRRNAKEHIHLARKCKAAAWASDTLSAPALLAKKKFDLAEDRKAKRDLALQKLAA